MLGFDYNLAHRNALNITPLMRYFIADLKQILNSWQSTLVNGHAKGIDSLEVPTIYKAYVGPMYVRGYLHKIWPYIYMVQYLHLGS